MKSSSFKQASTFKSSKSFFDMRAIQEVHLQSFASTRLVSDTVNIGESWRSAGWGHHRRNALHLTSASHRRLKGKACCRNVEKRGKQTESQLRSLRTRKNCRSISLSHYHAQLNWWLTASLSWWFGIRYAPMTGSILHELTPSISFPQILKSCPVGTRGVVLDLGPLRSKKSVEVQGGSDDEPRTLGVASRLPARSLARRWADWAEELQLWAKAAELWDFPWKKLDYIGWHRAFLFPAMISMIQHGRYMASWYTLTFRLGPAFGLSGGFIGNCITKRLKWELEISYIIFYQYESLAAWDLEPTWAERRKVPLALKVLPTQCSSLSRSSSRPRFSTSTTGMGHASKCKTKKLQVLVMGILFLSTFSLVHIWPIPEDVRRVVHGWGRLFVHPSIYQSIYCIHRSIRAF